MPLELRIIQRRLVKARVSFTDAEGNPREEELRVVCRPFTLGEHFDAFLWELEGKSVIDIALRFVTALPDVTEGSAPVPITREVFERLGPRRTHEIVRAVIQERGVYCGLREEWRGADVRR